MTSERSERNVKFPVSCICYWYSLTGSSGPSTSKCNAQQQRLDSICDLTCDDCPDACYFMGSSGIPTCPCPMSTYVVVEGGVPRCQPLGERKCSDALNMSVRIWFGIMDRKTEMQFARERCEVCRIRKWSNDHTMKVAETGYYPSPRKSGWFALLYDVPSSHVHFNPLLFAQTLSPYPSASPPTTSSSNRSSFVAQPESLNGSHSQTPINPLA